MRWSGHRLAAVACLAAAAPLVIAQATQHWGGLVPCALCLVERWPWRAAVAVGLVALLADWPALLWLAVAVALGGGGIAFVHVGVEQGWWPSPLPECAAPVLSRGNLAQMLASMPAHPAKPCDAPTYLLPGLLPGVSMAAMNLIYALVFAGGLALLLWRNRRRA